MSSIKEVDGYCGGQSFSLLKNDGSSVSSFLTIESGNVITLVTTDPSHIGQYTIELTVTLDDYPTQTLSQTFTVTLV